jgi:serine/threonine protein kinase
MAEVPDRCALDPPLEIPGYRLLGRIGEGGMGEVHQATQLSLQRTVAIKFLSSLDGEHTARSAFEREARAMAALAHPHVVTIHDCGQVHGRWFLVMEFMDARTLRQQMEPDKPLPLDRAALVLDAIAQALSYIHEQGILHLDLKPENVLCTASGGIKITDFGLASHVGSRKPCMPEAWEGTLDYCSPEQRYGLSVDRRSDVFSLATLAYEILTGHLPSRVYVPASERNRRLPRAVNAVLRKGLARDADDRYATPDAFRQALLQALRGAPRDTGRWPAWAATAAAALVVLSVPAWWQASGPPPFIEAALPAPPSEPGPLARLLRLTPFGGTHELLYPCLLTGKTSLFLLHPSGRTPLDLTRDQSRCILPAYSPDGRRIAFTSELEDNSQIFVMDSDGGNVQQLTQAPGSNRAPAWSPDGKRIAFVSNRDGNFEVYVMDADGSSQVNLTDFPGFDGDPAWSPDGKLIVFPSERGENNELRLCIMDANGGNVRDLHATLSRKGYVYPAWSPDGKRIVYAGSVGSGLELFLCDTAGTEHRQCTNLGGMTGLPAWSPDGKRIAFQHTPPGEPLASLYLISAAGTNPCLVLAAAGPREGGRPAWKPK